MASQTDQGNTERSDPKEGGHTPGPWSWMGEDYRGGWGWMMLVGPNGEGLIVGQEKAGGICKYLKAHMPVDPTLCVTGMLASGKEHVEPVHVFSEANARLIAASPETFSALKDLVAWAFAVSEEQGWGWNSLTTPDCVVAAAFAIALAETGKR